MAGLMESWFLPIGQQAKMKSGPKATAGPAASPSAHSTITGASVAPGTGADQFKTNEGAYWQQLLQGTGQTTGGNLPQDIQSNIDQQAALIS